MKRKIVKFEPKIKRYLPEFIDFARSARKKLAACSRENFTSTIWRLRESILRDIPQSPNDICLRTAIAKSVLLDLAGLGWNYNIRQKVVYLRSMECHDGDIAATKAAVRRSHLVERDSQLRENSVREFVRNMERRRLTECGWHSIFSVMRDGKKLACQISKLVQIHDDSKKLQLSRDVIAPYLQFVRGDEKCDQTGLVLKDIWRYFRHTWVNAYKTLPGRSMMILVRDAAVENHPVIGIAALGSSVAQQKVRDCWIGWDQDTFVKNLESQASAKYVKWLLRTLHTHVQGIYLKDLKRDRLCDILDLDYPTMNVIECLESEADRAAERHRLFPRAADTKSQQRASTSVDWERQANMPLFRSKRCRTLARLLRIRMEFQSAGLKNGTKAELVGALKRASFRKSVGQLVRIIKAEHVGINMMDIIVCGAIPPYNTILGGKLVCMLLCSPEVVHEYSCRYGRSPSIIASSIQGAPVIRDAKLMLLCTTSLYGTGSSQYNRLRIPCGLADNGGTNSLVYKCLGRSEGFGSYHFSKETMKLMNTLLARNKRGRRVNSIFGEGVNPRLRKIREALEVVGLSPDELLSHGNSRVVYAASLVRNLQDSLLGLSKRPFYLLSQKNPKKRTEEIVDYWRERWFMKRVLREETVKEVSRHTLSYPITHGARVQLPGDGDQKELDF